MPTFRFTDPYPRTYSPPSQIGRATPGDVREFDEAPDHRWTEVDEKADAPVDAPSEKPAQDRRTRFPRTPEVLADTEPEVPAATEEVSE